MNTKRYTIELPAALPPPPEHFNIEVVSMQQTESVKTKDLPIKSNRDPLNDVILAYRGVLDAFVLLANATDGVSSIYAQWDTGNLQWSGWYDADTDAPADFANLAYWRAVDARAKLIYEKQQGNLAWFDCLGQAETEISAEISAAADAQCGRDAEIIAVTNQAIEEAQHD